ncbi:MAG: caspase family protein [Verrucomicrobia bacterium]|nr:caspase family protein [Verrucomicrobiota bacterium]
MPDYRILCIHGIGHTEQTQDWNQPWIDVLKDAFTNRLHTKDRLEFSALPYDAIFEKYPSNLLEDAEAVAELIGSAAYHAAADPLQPRAFEPLDNLKYVGRWYAGMVAQWVVSDALRKDLRAALSAAIQAFNPDIILAHSLGTLLSYDLFTHDDVGRKLAEGRIYITLGSQIANPFVRARMWGGRVAMVPAKRWYHLFNKLDPAFTAQITEPGQITFLQVETDSPAGHNPTTTNGNPGYLDHPNTLTKVWEPLSRGLDEAFVSRGLAIVEQAAKPPKRRALLVGINDYPDPAHKLNGCVNDVYSVSALLQQNGFLPEDITVLIDRRATKDAIIDRLTWLLSHADDQAERVFYYSGHGLQIPGRGPNGLIDHVEDGIVPVDFDWQKLNAITDRDLFDLYTQLPPTARFLAIFDTCFSGGLIQGQRGSVRNVPAPEEIRHGLQQGNRKGRHWEPRRLKPLLPDFDEQEQQTYTGLNGYTYKLGRAVPLRRVAKARYKELTQLRQHVGPYLPVDIEACKDDQQSYEYADGGVTHGAFTFALASAFEKPSVLSFHELERRIAKRLKQLGINQQPQIAGPKHILDHPIANWDQGGGQDGAGATGPSEETGGPLAGSSASDARSQGG